MKDEKKTQIKVGITVIIGTILFIWLLSWAKNYSLTSKDRVIKVKFDSAAGLEIGDQVTVNGVRKGFVDDLFVELNDVIVELSVQSDTDLREDASFGITMLDLMGGKKVEIKPGISPNKIDYDKVHEGKFYADIPAVMSMLGSAQEDLFIVLGEVKVTLTSINKFLTDEKLNSDLKVTLSNLNSVTQKLGTIIDENRQTIKKLGSSSLELTENAKHFIEANKEKINLSITELEKILVNVNTLISNSNRLLDETLAQKNNAGKVLYDENFYSDLKITLSQVKEVTEILIEQLKDKGLNIDAKIRLF